MLCKRELSSLVCYVLLVGGKQGTELFCFQLITPPTVAMGTAVRFYERHVRHVNCTAGQLMDRQVRTDGG